jgi:VanZ family protein
MHKEWVRVFDTGMLISCCLLILWSSSQHVGGTKQLLLLHHQLLQFSLPELSLSDLTTPHFSFPEPTITESAYQLESIVNRLFSMPTQLIQKFDTITLLAYSSIIFLFSNQSNLDIPQLYLHQDKLAHLSEYMLLGLFAWRCFRHRFENLKTLLIISLVFCSLYGALDEIHQYFIPNRQMDILDWCADTIGSATTIGTCFWLRLQNSRLSRLV